MSAAGVTLAAASPAASRVVEYNLDKAAIESAALDQGIDGPFSDAPDPTSFPFSIETSSAADHSAKIVSIYCQAYKMENPISALMQHLLPAASPSTSRPVLRLTKGSTLLRCLGSGEFKNICKNEVKLSAELDFKSADGTPVTLPVSASVERNGRVGGFCGNMARYTAIVSREAGIELLNKARAVYQQSTATTR